MVQKASSTPRNKQEVMALTDLLLILKEALLSSTWHKYFFLQDCTTIFIFFWKPYNTIFLVYFPFLHSVSHSSSVPIINITDLLSFEMGQLAQLVAAKYFFMSYIIQRTSNTIRLPQLLWMEKLQQNKKNPKISGCFSSPKHPVRDTNRVWLKKKESIFPWEYVIG